jgi:hypothetical membrane protein
VAAQWPTPFSLTDDVISALGNTTPCRESAAAASACSPWHALMNASFIVIGVTMSAGALLTRAVFTPGRARAVAVVLFLVGGVGVVLVGAYPENESELLHGAGAAANLFGANVALILFGLALPRRSGRTVLGVVSIALGVLGLMAACLFVIGEYQGLGVGGMERVAIYPITIWQIAAGLSLMRRR